MTEYWKERSNNIKENVTMKELTSHFNIHTRAEGPVAQINCPFHGSDKHASARIYETNTMYCWVCSSVWDVISFTKDILGISFHEACSYLEKNYGITKPDQTIAYRPRKPDFLTSKKKEAIPFDFVGNFTKVQDFLIRNRDSFTKGKYLNYFYYYDRLFFKYKTLENTPNVIDLEIPLKELYKEVMKSI